MDCSDRLKECVFAFLKISSWNAKDFIGRRARLPISRPAYIGRALLFPLQFPSIRPNWLKLNRTKLCAIGEWRIYAKIKRRVCDSEPFRDPFESLTILSILSNLSIFEHFWAFHRTSRWLWLTQDFIDYLFNLDAAQPMPDRRRTVRQS